MPLYSYECEKCGKKFDKFVSVSERRNVKCECGHLATKLIVGSATLIEFTPAWFHDICEESIYITSKKQLKNECKKHDVLAARLL